MENWIRDLATEHNIIACEEIKQVQEKKGAVYLSTDLGDKSACVKLLSYVHETKHTEKLKTFLLDVGITGKKAPSIASGIDHSLTSFGLGSEFKLAGQMTDSGGAAIESLGKALKDIDRAVLGEDYIIASCGLHNMQSLIREPIKSLLGDGGLNERTSLQCLHAMYYLQNLHTHERFVAFLKEAWKALHPWQSFPRDLLLALDAPVLTRWWTISIAAYRIVDYWELIHLVAQTLAKVGTTDESTNKTASNLDSLMREDMVYSDTCLIADFHNVFLDRHFKWQQGSAPVIQEPGFMSHHIFYRFFLMARDLEKLIASWNEYDSNTTNVHLPRFFKSLDKLEGSAETVDQQ